MNFNIFIILYNVTTILIFGYLIIKSKQKIKLLHKFNNENTKMIKDNAEVINDIMEHIIDIKTDMNRKIRRNK